MSPHPEPLGAGWWLDDVKFLMLHHGKTVAEAEDEMEIELTCGLDLYRTRMIVPWDQPPHEVVRVICPDEDMRRWLGAVRADGRCNCPKHTESALEEGLKRYASVALVKRHPNPYALNGPWEFKYFRGKQPMLGARHGTIEFNVDRKGQELVGG